jgi:probable rRNA maturation factor
VSPLVEVTNDTDAPVDEEAVRRLALEVLGAEGADGELCVAFVSEKTIAELNGRYRTLPEPTDVLSFPEADGEDDWPKPDEEDDGRYLGDVLVCPAVAADNAREDGVAPGLELARLVIHGVLHLLGYDHEVDQGEMMARQEELLRDLEPPAPALLHGE